MANRGLYHLCKSSSQLPSTLSSQGRKFRPDEHHHHSHRHGNLVLQVFPGRRGQGTNRTQTWIASHDSWALSMTFGKYIASPLFDCVKAPTPLEHGIVRLLHSLQAERVNGGHSFNHCHLSGFQAWQFATFSPFEALKT